MNLMQTLQNLGLTQYEAKAFKALVSAGTTTPFQISKISGIPRARIYDTLESLLKKGLIMKEELMDGSKTYRSIPIDVFLEQQQQNWKTSFQVMEEGLKQLESQQLKDESYVTTINGTESILSFCRNLIQNAERQVLLSMWKPMYEALLPDLHKQHQAGCRIRGITFGVENPLKGIHGHRQNDFMDSLSTNKWFILSIDSKELLYGHSAEKNESAFYTNDTVHLFLLEDYIWHDVLVNRLVEKGDQDQLDRWILPEMESFFGNKMVPESFWKKRNRK